jgi:hypothetical protein
MDNQLMPVRPGQVCKIISPIPDNEAGEVFIVAEDPAGLDAGDDVLVVNLKDLQRNIKDPDKAERIRVPRNELVVVSEDLENYIKSWNDR